jgi:plastocyanin
MTRTALACTLLLAASLMPAARALADEPSPAPAPAPQILIRNFMFAPTALTVPAGATVTWRNQDNEPHTVASDAGLFRSGALDTNDSFSFRFEKPGVYHFLCSIHPYMVGTITVQ